MNSDVIYVYRKDEMSHSRICVGEITREKDCFKFRYSDSYKDNETFIPILPFFDKEREYTNINLFPVFSSRLPDPKRIDIKNILDKYHLNEYDQFDLLRESQGRLPIDTLEFVSELSEEDVDGHTFFVAGMRHYMACKKKSSHIILKKGDHLQLVHEKDNAYDIHAVKILFNSDTIGYVPKYYSETYARLISKGCNLSAEVHSIKDCTCESPNSAECADCINVKISVKINSN